MTKHWTQLAATASLGCMIGCPAETPQPEDLFGGTMMESAGIPSLDDDTGADATGDSTGDPSGATDDSDSGEQPACGNGVIDPDEMCDAKDLGGESCVGLGFEAGQLACNANCAGFDLEGCGFFECGNGKAEGEEDCDGTVGAATCVDAGFDNGTLFCTTDCEYNTDQCGLCGDEILDDEEDCEPTKAFSTDCEDLGFDSGEVVCGKTCAFDTSGCQLCGNGTAEGTESCDGMDLGGATCASLGLEGGTLSCSGCGFDFSECDIQGLPFGSDGFYTGLSLNPGLLPCDEISGTGVNTGAGDDTSTVVNLGFSFPFYGSPFDQVTVSSNGTLNFGDASSPGLTNACFPSALENEIIAVYWDDLDPPDGVGGGVWTQTLGAVGSQRFVVQWDTPHYLGDANNLLRVQAVLHEAGNIDVCYVDTLNGADSGNSGAEATSGIGVDNANSVQFSCNTADLVDGLLLMYLPM